MRPTVYGIRRLLLLNSANYHVGLFPIDRPLSLFGPNNTGKTTAVNALQFLFLTDQREMRFGKHDAHTTRRYYFPTDSSYVLAEVLLEHGTYVIGVAGRGPAAGHAFQHFVLRGRLSLEHFRDAERLLNLEAVMRRLQADGITPYRVQPDELRRLLMGIPTSQQLDLCMIPLRQKRDRDFRTFLDVFKNLIHMRSITGHDMKVLLLTVFDTRLTASTVNYAADYERAYAEVNRQGQEIATLERIEADVRELQVAEERRQLLRGKLAASFQQIGAHLERWQRELGEIHARASATESKVDEALARLGGERTAVITAMRENAVEHSRCAEWLTQHEALRNRFALVDSRETLVRKAASLQREHEQAAEALAGLSGRSPAQVEAELTRRRRELDRAQSTLRYIESNVHGRLAERFSEDELRRLFTLLNRDILTLPLLGSSAAEASHDPDNGERHDERGHQTGGGVAVDDPEAAAGELQALLQRWRGEVFEGRGFRVDCTALAGPELAEALDPATLEMRITELTADLARLEVQLEVAEDLSRKQREKESLQRAWLDAERFIEAFDAYQSREQDFDDYQRRLAAAKTEEGTLAQREAGITTEEGDWLRRRQEAKEQLSEAQRRNRQIEELSARVAPLPAGEPDGTPCTGPLPDETRTLMRDHIEDSREKVALDERIGFALQRIEQSGAASYLRGNESDSLGALLEAVDSLPQKRELLERQRRSAISDLGNTLKTLFDNYDRLTHEVVRFNRAINRRSISNLTRVEVRLAGRERVLEAIRAIISEGAKDLLSVIDADSVTEAAAYLNRLVSERGSELGLVDLFDLNFVAFADDGRETVYRDLDAIESNGTTITIKALINMHMMSQLLDRPADALVNIPYYVDEAADIDPDNQRNLMEQGLHMGFVPILASVKPQINATYCISLPIRPPTGRHYLDENDWTVLEPKAPADASEHSQLA